MTHPSHDLRQGGLFPTCCCYSPTDAKKIVAGCSDGSVQLFFDKAGQRYCSPVHVLAASGSPAGGLVWGASEFGLRLDWRISHSSLGCGPKDDSVVTSMSQQLWVMEFPLVILVPGFLRELESIIKV